MLPSRCCTRPRDLQVFSRATGPHLDRFRHDHSPPSDIHTTPLPERLSGSYGELGLPHPLQRLIKDPSEAVDTVQYPWVPKETLESIQGPEGRATLPCEISSDLLSAEGHLFGNVQPRNISIPRMDSPLAQQLSFTSQQTHGFHTSAVTPYESVSYVNVNDVPDFFVKYKQHRATPSANTVHDPKNEEFGLMHTLVDSIVSGDVIASTRRLKSKIPVEHHGAEGRVVHPSGFVVPGPGHASPSNVARAKESVRDEKEDDAIQTAAVAHRVLESNFDHVDATTLPSLHKVPFEVHEQDGSVKHPSGFVPPTPAHKFRHIVNTSVSRARKVSAVQQMIRQPSPSRTRLRAVHTASTSEASEDV